MVQVTTSLTRADFGVVSYEGSRILTCDRIYTPDYEVSWRLPINNASIWPF
jgi:hypothetical protein